MFFIKKIIRRRKQKQFINRLRDIYLSEKASYEELSTFQDTLTNLLIKYIDIIDNMDKKDQDFSIRYLNVLAKNYMETTYNINGIYLELLDDNRLDLTTKTRIARFAKQSITISNKTIDVLDKLITLISTREA